MKKSELRKILKSRRNNMTNAEISKKSEEICQKIITSDFFKISQNIMVYLSFSSEVDTKDIINEAFLKKKNVLVPVTVGDDITVCVLKNFDSLKKGAFGIDEPIEKKQWHGDIDLCIIPALGFDKTGGRIGFGRGYYDRFLSKKTCKKVGIAYENQIEETVFPDAHDIPMDIIVTEREIFYFE